MTLPAADTLKIMVFTSQGEQLKETISADSGTGMWKRHNVKLTPQSESFQVTVKILKSNKILLDC